MTPDVHTILAALNKAAESFNLKIHESKKKEDWKEALALSSKKEGIKISISIIKHLNNRNIEIV